MDESVSFKIAKLLKEKGFDKIYSYSNFYTEGYPDNYPLILYITKEEYISDKEEYKKHYVVPTIAEIVMWLYEEYGIWIYVSPKTVDTSTIFIPHGKTIPNTIKNGLVVDIIPYTTKISPTEAYEAAIEYTLNNLI